MNLHSVIDFVECAGNCSVHFPALGWSRLPLADVLLYFLESMCDLIHIIFIGAKLHHGLVRKDLEIIREAHEVVCLQQPGQMSDE